MPFKKVDPKRRLGASERLEVVSRFFDVDKVINLPIDRSVIRRYYHVNKWAYRFFHNDLGFVHMAISDGKEYDRNDLYAQAKIVEDLMEKNGFRDCLELAVGQGGSIIYLAKKHPDWNFEGVDLPDGQLDVAKTRANGLNNVVFYEGDYHDLSRFPDSSKDMIFVVEALCHTLRKDVVLGEVYRILRPGGMLMVIDAYADRVELSDDLKKVKGLVERSMAVESFESHGSFSNQIVKSGFTIIRDDDVTGRIEPSLRRFERMARKLVFDTLVLGKVLVSLFPSVLTTNAIAAYLMRYASIEEKVFSYNITVGKK